MKNLKFVSFFALFLFSFYNYAQEHHHSGNDLTFVKNNGQWENTVLYKASLGGLNTIFLEEAAFTLVFHEEEAADGLHDYIQRQGSSKGFSMQSHAYKVHFNNARPIATTGLEKRLELHDWK